MFMIIVVTALMQANCRAIQITVTSGGSTADDQQSGQCLVTYHYLPPQKVPEATDNANRPTEAIFIFSPLQGQLETSATTTAAPTDTAAITTTVISFNVRLSETKTYSSTGSNIVFDRVVDNSGHSYDLSTGRVTAPLTGRYYFAVTTISPAGDRANIMVNGSMLCRVTSAVPNEVASCQGIRHMAAGDQAWVQAYNGTNTLKANASSFAGFLLAGAGDVSRVSFTVRMTSNKQYRKYRETLTWDQAQDNFGRSMNMTSGTFTAPVTGQYFFALTLTSTVDYPRSCANIMADGVTICVVCPCSSNDCRNTGSCQATARLTAGRTAWVETYGSDQLFRAQETTFSGFLMRGDHEPSVSFTATLTTGREYITDGERVVWDRTTDNTGGGYDNNTGHFTAPVAGHYFLAVTARSWTYYSGDVEVMTSQGQIVCRVDFDVNEYDSGSCQGVVRLDKGQQVWVETLHCPCNLYPHGQSVFTGFLIQPATV